MMSAVLDASGMDLLPVALGGATTPQGLETLLEGPPPDHVREALPRALAMEVYLWLSFVLDGGNVAEWGGDPAEPAPVDLPEKSDSPFPWLKRAPFWRSRGRLTEGEFLQRRSWSAGEDGVDDGGGDGAKDVLFRLVR